MIHNKQLTNDNDDELGWGDYVEKGTCEGRWDARPTANTCLESVNSRHHHHHHHCHQPPQEEETEHSTGYCAQSASLCIVPMYTATDRDLRTPLLTFVVQEEAVGWNGAVLIQYATYTPSDPPTTPDQPFPTTPCLHTPSASRQGTKPKTQSGLDISRESFYLSARMMDGVCQGLCNHQPTTRIECGCVRETVRAEKETWAVWQSLYIL